MRAQCGTVGRAAWLAVALVAAVNGVPAAAGGSDAQRDQTMQAVDSLATKRQQRQDALRAMTVTELARELRSDAERGREPFQLVAYGQMVARGAAAASELRAQLSEPTRVSCSAFSPAPDRQHSLPDAPVRLRRQCSPTRCGPRRHLTRGASLASIGRRPRGSYCRGRSIVPSLRPLLADERPAPLWGTEASTESRRLGLRVRDYAWALTQAIVGGGQLTFPADPSVRDSAISAMQRRPPR
jgi:hypothetical protein